MIIPNHKQIYKSVAEENQLALELVEKVGQFAWEDLNKRISTFENREIYMLKLGVFKFRKVKGENYLRQLKKSIAMISENPLFSEEEREDQVIKVTNKIAAMETLLEEWEVIIKEREKFKYEQNIRYIQEQGADMGRSTK